MDIQQISQQLSQHHYTAHRALASEWQALTAGLRSSPALAAMLLISLLDTLGSAAHNVGFPVLSQYISPDTTNIVMGYLLAVWACGKFAGGAWPACCSKVAPRKAWATVPGRRRADVQRVYSHVPANRAVACTGVTRPERARSRAPAAVQLTDLGSDDRLWRRDAAGGAVLHRLAPRPSDCAVPWAAAEHADGHRGLAVSDSASCPDKNNSAAMSMADAQKWGRLTINT